MSPAQAAAGMIVRLPNAAPKFVALPADLAFGSTGEGTVKLAEVCQKVRSVLCEAFGWDADDSPRVLFKEKDLESDGTAAAFLASAASGLPCVVRVVFRLLGGKGGFGALLRKQMGMGKKTTNFDSMRDLSGRRLRHSKAVDRIKEWMEERRRQDDLVNLLTGEGPELPKPTPESESLDPKFMETLKRSAANKSSLVKEGLKKLDAEAVGAPAGGTSAPSQEQAAKRQRVEGASSTAGGASPAAAGEAGGGWLSALETLGEVSSPEQDSADDTAAAAKDTGSNEAPAKAAPKVVPKTVKCKAGHICARLTKNPEEKGYDEPACCDLCDAEDLPGTRPFFFHCTACEFDLCPDCAADPAYMAACSSSAPASAPSSKAAASSAAAASASSKPATAAGKASAPSAAPAPAAASNAATAPGGRASAPAAQPAPAEPAAPDDGRVLTAADVRGFASAEELLREVHPEAMKRSLQKLGLKCGGKPEERASRLFLLKTSKLGALPKALFASK